ncbi:response regulator transcription factor [Chryseobacterium vaccae]|uniref:response regulator transcription factor n=1 Tax=Chryseobacterium vaccae TaxID=2604424 RepID=UPI001629D9E5|nr:response regulator transcription factor [Chryseobacterium vaccae]
MRKSFYLFILLFYFDITFCQNRPSGTTPNGISIDRQLDEISKESKTYTALKQEKLLLKLMSESKKEGYDWGVIRSGSALTSVYLGQGEYKKTIDLSNELKKVINNKKDIYGHISSIYRRNALALGYLGLNDASLKDFRKAITYAKQIENEDRKKHQLAFSYENINIYYENKEKEPGINDTILSNYLKAFEIAKTISDKNTEVFIDDKYGLIAYLSMAIGSSYIERNALETAEKYLLNAKNIYENKNYNTDPTQKAETFNELSKLYIKKKLYQQAIEYATNALKFEKQHSFPFERKQTYEHLLQAYLKIGDDEKAEFYREKFTALSDSLNYEEKKTANLTMKKMVTDEINEHKAISKKQLIAIISLFLFATIVTSLLWRRKNKNLHRNYEDLIAKIKDKEDTSYLFSLTTGKTENNETKFSVTIPDETSKVLLEKLEKFEKSGKFLKKDITLSSLSTSLDTNPRYLSEIIKQYTGKNFNNYLNGLRIQNIIQLLYNEPVYREYKITYLAEYCGFASTKVFTTAFKKETGVTPSYFVEQLKVSA